MALSCKGASGHADDFGFKDNGREDTEMSRRLQIAGLAFCLVLLVGCAAPLADHAAIPSMTSVPALAEVGSGVYVVARHGASTGNNVLLTQDRRIYVRASERGDNATELAVEELKAHRNNIYGIAVNTRGISHATVAIRRGGRVILQAGLMPGDEPAVIAMRGSETGHTRDKDKSGDPRLARSD